MIQKAHQLLTLIWNAPKIIYFNFYYLPFGQAIKFPIWLYNAKLAKMGGKVIINSPHIKSGMIRLGIIMNPLYKNTRSGIVWENNNIVRFKGTCIIGHNSAFLIGKNGNLEFGDNFLVTTSVKIASFKKIVIGNNCRFSWENIVTDTDFHETINIETGKRSNPSKEIIIGNNNWMGIRSIILKGTVTPDFCVFGAGSLLNKKYDVPSYSVLAGSPLKVVKSNVYRDLKSIVE